MTGTSFSHTCEMDCTPPKMTMPTSTTMAMPTAQLGMPGIEDVMMPVMDGLDATRAIRAMERPDAALPIIAMTANLFDEDVAACLEAGMDGHIPKPLDAAQMLRTIVECIRRKRHDA